MKTIFGIIIILYGAIFPLLFNTKIWSKYYGWHTQTKEGIFISIIVGFVLFYLDFNKIKKDE